MTNRKPISLNSLSLNHRDEVDRMLAGIRGDADRVPWTAELRAAIRGGKPCGQTLVHENDGNNQ